MKHMKIAFRILTQILAGAYVWSERKREYTLYGNPDITISLGKEKPNSAKPETSRHRSFRNSGTNAYASMNGDNNE